MCDTLNLQKEPRKEFLHIPSDYINEMIAITTN